MEVLGAEHHRQITGILERERPVRAEVDADRVPVLAAAADHHRQRDGDDQGVKHGPRGTLPGHSTAPAFGQTKDRGNPVVEFTRNGKPGAGPRQSLVSPSRGWVIWRPVAERPFPTGSGPLRPPRRAVGAKRGRPARLAGRSPSPFPTGRNASWRTSTTAEAARAGSSFRVPSPKRPRKPAHAHRPPGPAATTARTFPSIRAPAADPHAVQRRQARSSWSTIRSA